MGLSAMVLYKIKFEVGAIPLEHEGTLPLDENAKNSTQKFRISLSVSNTVVITVCNYEQVVSSQVATHTRTGCRSVTVGCSGDGVKNGTASMWLPLYEGTRGKVQ